MKKTTGIIIGSVSLFAILVLSDFISGFIIGLLSFLLPLNFNGTIYANIIFSILTLVLFGAALLLSVKILDKINGGGANKRQTLFTVSALIACVGYGLVYVGFNLAAAGYVFGAIIGRLVVFTILIFIVKSIKDKVSKGQGKNDTMLYYCVVSFAVLIFTAFGISIGTDYCAAFLIALLMGVE